MCPVVSVCVWRWQETTRTFRVVRSTTASLRPSESLRHKGWTLTTTLSTAQSEKVSVVTGSLQNTVHSTNAQHRSFLNVSYNTRVFAAIRIWGDRITVRRNLVTMSLWTGSYQDREEAFNYEWNAAIEVRLLKRPEKKPCQSLFLLFWPGLCFLAGQQGDKRCAAAQHRGRLRAGGVSHRRGAVSR